MNSKRKKFAANLTGKNGVKNLVISIVILVEILAIFCVATYAWVETVSSIKIATESNGQLEVDTYVFTEATIGGTPGTIDMGKYFKQSGDMHFAPASSADGVNMFFPKLTSNGTAYVSSGGSRFRKGNTSDMNTAYMSVTFKLRADTNADFFFDQAPSFSNQGSNMRVSVTAYTEGTSEGDLYDETGKPKFTKIYGASASSNAVVSNTGGGTSTAAVEAFSSHIKGTGSNNRLFAVGANETKIVTIKVWLQGSSMNNNLPQNISITNFGITSSLTPRHVTLIPTPTWDISNTTEYFYAWCWGATNGDADRLYGPLTLDENEHYSFDYNGTYQSTLFIRCGNANLTTESMSTTWSSLGLWNKTGDTTIPNDPVDPTYIIETISGGAYDGDISGNKSTGSWHDPATIHVATAEGQSTWGTVNATSYRSTSVNGNEIIESTNPSSQKHKDTVHAWPGKKVRLTASVSDANNYAFVGWYDNPECTGNALSTSATYDIDAPSIATEVAYFAKFKETRTLTINKYVDGSSSSTAAGTITIGGHTSGSSVTSYSYKFDKGTQVSFSASAETGYTLQGIYTTASGDTLAGSPVTLNENTTYYARFTTNTHTVNINAIGSTGSTVQYGNETAATSVSKTGVKYNTSVTIKANPATGYKFVGWYTDSAGTTAASGSYTNASYTFTLGDADVTYYAKFAALDIYLTGYINGADESGTTHHFTAGSNGNYTYTYKFTGGSNQYVTIFDGTNAYHPGTHGAGSGAAANTSMTDTTPAGPNGNKWLVPACKGATVTFTWNHSNKTLSWTINSRELFLKPNSNWTQDSARFAAYVYGNGDTWYSMSSAGSGYYKVTVDAKYPNVIFCRMNGSNTTNNWNNKWNQTGDLTIPADNNCFTIPSGAWDGSTTTWSLY